PARDRAGTTRAARATLDGSGTAGGNGAVRTGGDRDACSPPLLVAFEKACGAVLRAAERLDPVVEQVQPVLGDRVAALGGAGGVLVPLGGDELFLLEAAQQPVEVPHLDPLLARQLGQAFEQ